MNKLPCFCNRLKTFYRVRSTTPALARVEVWQPTTNEWNTGCHLSLHLTIAYDGLWPQNKLRDLSRNSFPPFPPPPPPKKRTLYRPPASQSQCCQYFFPLSNMKVSAPFPGTYGLYACYYVSLSIRPFYFISAFLLFCFLFRRIRLIIQHCFQYMRPTWLISVCLMWVQ